MSTTYTQLLTDAAAYADRDDSRLATQLPSLLSQAEQRITLDASAADPASSVTVGAIIVATGAFTTGDGVVAKPVRWRQTVQFNYDAGTSAERRAFIHRRSYAFCRRFWPNPAATAAPRYYADYDLEHFLIVGTPADDYEFELSYYERVEPLSVSNQTNWLTEHYDALLLYALLLEMQPFLKRDERVQVWQAAYTDALQKLVLEQKRREAEIL